MTENTKNQKKRISRSFAEKIEIINDSNTMKLSKNELAKKYKISRSVAYKIIQDKEKILELAKTKSSDYLNSQSKLKKCRNPELERRVLKWGKENHDKWGKMFSWQLVQDTAKEISLQLDMPDFKASAGWLGKFRKRYNLPTYSSFGDVVIEDCEKEDQPEEPAPILVPVKPVKIETQEESGKLTRNTLTHAEKLEIINEREKSGTKMCVLAQKYNVSSSTVSLLLKEKDKYLILAGDPNHSMTHKRMKKGMPLDDPIIAWYNENRGKIKVTRKMLQDKAMEVAEQMGLDQFKGSNGWVSKFIKRKNIFLKDQGQGQDQEMEVKYLEEFSNSDENSTFMEDETQIKQEFEDESEEMEELFQPSQEEFENAMEILHKRIFLTPNIPENVLDSYHTISSYFEDH